MSDDNKGQKTGQVWYKAHFASAGAALQHTPLLLVIKYELWAWCCSQASRNLLLQLQMVL